MTGLEKATLTNTVTGRRVAVQFNPEEYTLDRETTFAQLAVPGLSAPVVQFVNGNARVLSMDLLFDTWTDGQSRNVLELTAPLTDLLSIDGDLHAPPRVEFRWGVFQFVAVVENRVWS